MKDKILAFLKTKLAGFAGGVENEFLLEYADHFNKTIKEETEIATTLTDGVIDQIKVAYGFYNKEVVKKTAAAQETALKNFREKHGLNEDGTPIKKPVGRPPKNKDNDSDDDDSDDKIPEWAKKILADQTELKQKLEQQAQEKTLASLTERVKSHEKLKDIPVSYLKGRNLTPKSEAEVDQLVAEIESDYVGFKQEMAEKGVVLSIPPEGGGQSGDKVTIQDYLDDKFPKDEK
jgi:hypothetical protein